MRNSISLKYAASTFSVDAVESFLEMNIVDVQVHLPFSALLDDVVQSEDLVRASSSFSKTCLLLSDSLVHCFKDLPNDELG